MKWKLLILIVVLALVFAPTVMAQSTTVSGQVTDAGLQAWNNGTITAVFVINPSYPSFPQYTWTGGTLNSQVSGTLSSTGSYSLSIPSNSAISPVNSQWRFQVCPQASSPCFYTSPITITGATQTANITPPIILINLQSTSPPVSAYSTAEVTGAILGSQFFLIGTGQQVCSSISGNNCLTWVNGSINSVNGPGPVFNVKGAGAKGDAQATGTSACNFVGGNAQFTCTGTAFSSATDVGKNIFCNSTNAGFSFFGNSLQTIISVQGPGTATASTTAGASAPGGCVWGTLDDVAISAASAAAVAASKSVAFAGNKGIFTASPTLYFPSSGYLTCTVLQNGMVNLSAQSDGFTLAGDGKDQSIIYTGGGGACPLNGLGALVAQQSGGNNLIIRDLTFDGVNNTSASGSNALFLSGSSRMSNVLMERWGGNSSSPVFLGGTHILENFLSVNNQGVGVTCANCSGEWESGGSSNNASSANLVISNVVGSNTGQGFRVGKNVLIDECGTNPTGCTQVTKSQDVWFIGPALFGTPNGFCLSVDSTSFVHWEGGICGTFGNDTNVNGPNIQAGGILQASDVRMIGSGTGKCITNSGIFNDNGGNSCENMFPIASGTSTGTTAVLTLTTVGANVNANCSVGDALIVEGAGIPGYNGYFAAGAASGITATSATTLTYTTAGSNLGALGAGGVAHCRNLQTFSGTLPKALLNNPIPNTCYLTITPITNATTFNLCNWGAGTATNITRITASSQVVTTCATPPIVTISNGTVSETLTLTSGKQFWDSFNAQDLSTGVGTTIFKPSISVTGTDRITIKYDVAATSACATPPTNLGVTYTIAPILSN